VRRHTENLFRAIERKNWEAVSDFIGSDYQDQWGYDRARVLERLRESFRYIRGPRIIASNSSVQVETQRAAWRGKIMLYSSDDEVMEALDQRINRLSAPFELEWHQVSGKPWDWKLTRVSNPTFEIPADIYWSEGLRAPNSSCNGVLNVGRWMLSVERSALIPRRYILFSLCLAQLGLGSLHIARRLLAKQDRAEFFSLITACSEFFLRIGALKINTRWQYAEIANEIHP
jgi:hypothetical protein